MSVVFQYIDAIIFYKDMFGCKSALTAQRAHDAIITSLWRQNDVATSFRHHNDVSITSGVR